jgi:hypothetical protein
VEHAKCAGSIYRGKLEGKGAWRVRQFPDRRLGVEIRQQAFIQDVGIVLVKTFFFPPFCPKCGQRLNPKRTSISRCEGAAEV